LECRLASFPISQNSKNRGKRRGAGAFQLE
jgi:hypothetical protein